eukprot:102674_1
MENKQVDNDEKKTMEDLCLIMKNKHWDQFFTKIDTTNNQLSLRNRNDAEDYLIPHLTIKSCKIGLINIYDSNKLISQFSKKSKRKFHLNKKLMDIYDDNKLMKQLSRYTFILNNKNITIFNAFSKIIEVFYGLSIVTLDTKYFQQINDECIYKDEYVDGHDYKNDEYSTTDILDRLKKIKKLKCHSELFILIGICFKDLYNNYLSEVYGIAYYDKGVAACSLMPEKKGIKFNKRNKLLHFKRKLKVLIHEIGHLFGLGHCKQFLCVMNGTNHNENAQDVNDIDKEPVSLCPICLNSVYLSICYSNVKKMDLLNRYKQLQYLFGQFGLKKEELWYMERVQFLQRNVSDK